MDPKNKKIRQIYQGGPTVNTVNADDIFGASDNFEDNYLDFDDLYSSVQDGTDTFESFDIEPNPNSTLDDENLRIESIRQATNIAKLLTNVTVADILKIADSIYNYLK
jgi:hypothetical protein